MTPVEPKILLLIPAYNEAGRIGPVLQDYCRYFHPIYGDRFSITVVLNGCTDNTLEVVKKVSMEWPCVQCLDFPGRIGKGGALIEGLKLAPHCDWIGYVDADGATQPAAFHDLIHHIKTEDCVIGSRWVEGAVIHEAQTGRRRFASRIFNALVRLCFGLPFHDTQCGAKIMRREAVEKVHSSLLLADMAFDINLLYSLRSAGYRIREVPTQWTDKIGSKVHLGKTSLVMALSVLRLRLVHSPFYSWLLPLRPLETWIYKRLSAPPPLPAEKLQGR